MENFNENVHQIPANYTDSGKMFGGLVSPRNLVEAMLISAILGYVEVAFIPMTLMIRVIVMVITILPIAVVALIGLDGESMFQYIGHMLRYVFRRRKLHFVMNKEDFNGKAKQ